MVKRDVKTVIKSSSLRMKLRMGFLKRNPSVDFSLIYMYLITIGHKCSYSINVLIYFSGKTEYQTTKTNKARRSTSFERRPSKRYSRRTLQMKGEMQHFFKGLFFLDNLWCCCCLLERVLCEF